jgi:hypothetical protein
VIGADGVPMEEEDDACDEKLEEESIGVRLRRSTGEPIDAATQTLGTSHLSAQIKTRVFCASTVPLIIFSSRFAAVQVIDTDYYVGQPLDPVQWPEMKGSREGPAPIVRLFGVTETGQSILVHAHCFTPYFYVQAPPGFTEHDCGIFRTSLNVCSQLSPSLYIFYFLFLLRLPWLALSTAPCITL